MGKKFGARLSGMRKIVEKEKAKANTSPKWNKKNPVRQQMQDDVVEGSGKAETSIEGAIGIPFDMHWRLAKQLRKEYQEMGEKNFRSRLSAMHTLVNKKLDLALEDAKALANDRLLYPRPEKNFRGDKQWIDSDAKTLLEIDVEDGVHKLMSPKALYQSRQQYQDACSLQVFRGHIYQEAQMVKWRAQWVGKRKEYAIVDPPTYFATCSDDELSQG